MPRVRFFAAARDATGCSRVDLDGHTVGEVLDAARSRFGDGFDQVLAASRVWVNGEPAAVSDTIAANDELAVLPPVSGG